MSYVIIYEDSKKQIKTEVASTGLTKRIVEIEASGGYYLRILKEDEFNKQQHRKRKVSGWNQ